MDQALPQKDVIKTKDCKGLKVGATTCGYSHKGDLIMAGCSDGSIQIWDTRSQTFYRPSVTIEKAHDML